MRHFSILIFSVLLFSLPTLQAQTGIPVSGMSHCDTQVEAFLSKYDIPGATLAVAKDGKLVYARGFGFADLAGTEPVQPYHMFRIASVSKPITAIAVMKLVEDGQLNLSDKVFGSNGLLANHPYLSTVTYSDSRIDDITVEHLLVHRAGWNRDVGCIQGIASPYTWTVNHCDPIGFPLYVTQLYGETNPVREEVLIRFLMEQGLNFAPGTDYAYSNIGYLVLGEIIKSVTGKSYEDYVQDAILAPLGICDMHIGHNLLADKFPREAEYEGQNYKAPSVYGTGESVPWEYGGWNLEAMDAHGGWIATARDLVRLLSAVDGFSTRPDILNSTTINTMVTPPSGSSYYAKGWQVNAFNNWWHTGALDGTASIVARTNGGYLWALILNKRIIDNRSNQFWADLDGLPWACVNQTTSWPSHDLFEVPAGVNSLSAVKGNDPGTVELSWTGGSGDGQVVVVHESSAVNLYPLDGTVYAANSQFGQGEDLGDGHFVVFSGTGNSATVTGLDPTKSYHFRIFDFNANNSTGNHALYQLCEAPVVSINLSWATSIDDLASLGIRCFPNPGRELMRLSWESGNGPDRVEVRNLQGQLLLQERLTGTGAVLNTADWPVQVYLVSCFRQGEYLGSLRWIRQ